MNDTHLTEATFAIVLAGGRDNRLMQLTDWRAVWQKIPHH